MVAIRGGTFKKPWRRSCHSSKLKSSSAPIGREDSWCFHAVGSSNAPLLGSTAAEGLPRIGRTSIATRWRSCGLPQSASCSENFVIPPDVFGQTLSTELTAKRLELLREMLPRASRIAVLVNPTNTVNTQTTLREVEAAGRAIGFQMQIVNAGTSREIDMAFAAFTRERPNAVFLGQDAFFNGRRLQLANWAARHALPMTAGSRDICEVGGLMSYGSNIVDTYRQRGVYTGRILKGAKPADLPVEQSAKFELVINAQTARILGIEIPSTLLARADEVIE